MSEEKLKNGQQLKWTHRLSIFILVGGIIFILFVVLFQHHFYKYPEKTDLSNVQIADTESYKYHVDQVSSSNTQGEYIYIRGWAAHLGVDLLHYNTQLVLYTDDDLSNALVFKLAMKNRTDVTSHFDDGYNYDSSGFTVNLKSNILGNKVYNVALLYNDTKTDDGLRLILTDTTINCGGDE